MHRCNKGPNVRVRQENGNWLEFNKIENVERVYKILRDYLGANVSNNSYERSSKQAAFLGPLRLIF